MELGSPASLPLLTPGALNRYLSLAPDRSLQASGWVYALLLLPEGGIAAGTFNSSTNIGTVDLWPTAVDVQGGGVPVTRLQASGMVNALLSLPNGGIAAGTSISSTYGTVDLWPDADAVAQGGVPVIRLPASGVVNALMSLQGDDGASSGIAAGTWSGSTWGTVDLWPDIQKEGPPGTTLPVSGAVTALLSLPGHGIGAGTHGNNYTGTIDIWPNATAVQHGGSPVTTLHTSGVVQALVFLPGGGIAAGTATADSGTVDLWPNATAVLCGGLPVMSLRASGPVSSLLLLAGGELAAGTLTSPYSGGVDLWPNATAGPSGGRPVMSLQASGIVNALLSLPNGGLAAGTQGAGSNTGRVDLWPDAAAVQQGSARRTRMREFGRVLSLVSLPSGGIAAGSSRSHTVDVWPGTAEVVRGGLPEVRLQTAGPAQALLSLQDGGILAGTATGPYGDSGTIDIWPDAAAVRSGSLPVSFVNLNDAVNALLSLPAGVDGARGGLAAGTSNSQYGQVKLWPDISAALQGSAPTTSLWAEGAVQTLLLLNSSGRMGIAAGTVLSTNFTGTVDIWYDVAAARTHETQDISLIASGAVHALLLLPGGGIAAGTWTGPHSGAVDLWPNASALRQRAHAATRLHASGPVNALMSLPGGGIAAATGSQDGPYSGTVDLWPDVASSGLVTRLQASGSVFSLLSLPGGGMAAGTKTGSNSGTIDLWPDPADKDNMTTNDTASVHGAVLPLTKQHASDHSSTVRADVWPDATRRPHEDLLSQYGGTAKVQRRASAARQSLGGRESVSAITPSGFVFTAVKLAESIALGVLRFDGGTVLELWSLSGVLQANLSTSGLAVAAAQLQSGHLVVATSIQTISVWAPAGASAWELRPNATLLAQGPVKGVAPLADGSFAALSATGGGGILELWTLAGAGRSVKLPHAPTSLLAWQEGVLVGSEQGLEFRPLTSLSEPQTLNMSGRVTALKAPPGGGLLVAAEHKVYVWATARGALQGSAPDLILSTPGIASGMAILHDGTLLAGGAAFASIPCSAGTYSLHGLTCLPCREGWLSQSGASSCYFPDSQGLLQSCGLGVVVLVAGIVLSHYLTRLPQQAAEQLAGGKRAFAAVGSVLTSLGGIGLMAHSCSVSAGVLVASAALGSLLLLPRQIAQTDAQFLALTALIVAGFQLVQWLLAPEGHEVLTVAGAVQSQKTFYGFVVLAIGLGLTLVAYAIPREQRFTAGRALPSPEEHPNAVLRRAMLALEVEAAHESRGPFSRFKEAAKRISGQFVTEHLLSITISVITAVQMGWQYHWRPSGDPGATLILLSVLVAVAQGLISSIAILITAELLPRCVRSAAAVVLDPHFRLALALKELALALKLMVLTMPFTAKMDDVYLWWQCLTPAYCPANCTNQRGGTCGTTFLNGIGACTCSALESGFYGVMINSSLSVGVSLCFTLLPIPSYWTDATYLRSIAYPRGKLVAQTFLALVPATIQMLYLLMIFQAQQCLALADIAIIIYPSLFLELMASEVKRALHGWSKERPRRYSTLFSDHLLLALRPFGVATSSLAAAACMARFSSVGTSWPSDSVDCSEKQSYWAWAVMSLALFIGALAAGFIGPVAAPREDNEEREPGG